MFWYKLFGINQIAKNLDKVHKHQDFVYECAIYLDAGATSVAILTKRQKLTKNIKQAFHFNIPTAPQIAFKRIKRLLDTLSQMYTQTAKNVPRFFFKDLQLIMTCIYASQNKMSKIIKLVVKVFTLFRFVVINTNTLQTLFTIVRCDLFTNNLVKMFLHIKTFLQQ